MANYILMATIDRFEGGDAVLRFDDGQELVVSLEALPEGTGEGAKLSLSFAGDASSEADSAEQARAVLNEILQGQ